MPRQLTLQLPEEIDQALQQAAARSGRSPEQVALEWIESHVEKPALGSVDAILPSFGAWSMTPEERVNIERMIEEDRLLEDDHR